jgi:hypothetical protein
MSTHTPEEFMQYFRSNYPGPSTIISSPDWHAPKIYRAAIHASGYKQLVEALEAAAAVVCSLSCESVKTTDRPWHHSPLCVQVTAALALARGEQP